MILALGSSSFHVNGAFNRKGLKATNPVTSILQPKQLYPHFHPPWKKTRDASSSLKITLETSVSGSGCIKLLKVTGDFSQLLSALQSVMVFPVLFITFFSDSFSIVREKIPQSTGNCCRKSHVILSISMKPGPGPAVFAQKRSDASLCIELFRVFIFVIGEVEYLYRFCAYYYWDIPNTRLSFFNKCWICSRKTENEWRKWVSNRARSSPKQCSFQ